MLATIIVVTGWKYWNLVFSLTYKFYKLINLVNCVLKVNVDI